MKKNLWLLFTCLLVFSISIYGQIPNGDFESWTNGSPDNWYTNNIPTIAVPITQVSGHNGSAVKGAVIDVSGTPYPPLLISGAFGGGFPINSRPGSIQGYYKFESVQSDTFWVYAIFTKNGAGIGGTIPTFTLQPTSIWTPFSENTYWISSETPDTAYVYALIYNTTGTTAHVGSAYYLDDLTFGAATDVNDFNNGIVKKFELNQNYPNPFNPTTTIKYKLPKNSFVTLKIYDILGKEVQTLVDEYKHSGIYKAEFNAANLPSGVYFYRLTAGNFIEVKKMILQK